MYLAEFSASPTLRVVDVDTGVVTSSTPLSIVLPTDFASSPDGGLFATTYTSLYQVNPSTGASTLIGSPSIGSIVGLEFDCAGGAYVVTDSGNFASIDLGTGQAQLIDSYQVTFSGDITTQGGGVFFATFNSAGGSSLARIDVLPNGSNFQDLGVAVPGASLLGLDFDGFGRLIASDNNSPLGGLHEITGFNTAGPLGSQLLTSVPGLNGSIAGIASFLASGQQQVYCNAAPNSCGTIPTLTVNGVASASDTSGFLLTASNLPGQTYAALFMTISGRTSQPFGMGTLCLTQPRPVQVMWTNGSPGQCDGFVAVDVNSLISPSFLDLPGQLVQCQFISRDGQSAVLTQALEFSVCN
ncbi:hypothetical protein Poly30_03330 [Planctomycetes bacterium Poly30]|uniref:Uncharacterized protein n=2 Tax=Saltatorellus ferox TaxID=2528018 RepID=A0A518EL68_9BACT|nr:hypothetical protein Poly30_03330 [Planctomycetes bacterium Poly30]